MNFSKRNYEQHKVKKNFVNRKLSFIVVVLLGFMYSASAQEISPNAIGLRFGDNDGFGAEITYQRKLKETKRLEVDLGFRDNKNFDIWKLTGIHQWVWRIDGGFNWYAGFGAGLGNVDIKGLDNDDDGLFVNAVGNVGIEYDFEIPLLISLDFRPEFGIVNDFGSNDLGLDIALGIRYQF